MCRRKSTHIPDWAVWKNEAYAITAEPIVIVYNKNLVAESDIPKTRSELTTLLSKKPDAYRGKIASYDPEQSGAGFLFITRDSRITKTTWEMVRAFGGAGIKLYSTTGTVLDRISSGEHLIAYNVIGSYAIERAKEDASIGVVFPADYITLMSRIAFIPVAARHPEIRQTVSRLSAFGTRPEISRGSIDWFCPPRYRCGRRNTGGPQ